MDKGKIHVVIGDTQCRPGTPVAHLGWIGRYIVDQFVDEDVTLVHLGDHWDMPSLSSYDKGTKSMEGRRIQEDIDAGNAGFRLLNKALIEHNKTMRKTKHAQWWPRRVLLRGNHEARITKAIESNAQLDGLLSYDKLDTCGWEVHEFLEVVIIDGISYSHYFYHPNTGRPYGGENLLPRLKTIGRSFVMGHQQGLQYTLRQVGDRRHHGMVLGSSYLHSERYMGPQADAYWRGIAVLHQVDEGQFDPMFVSLDYLSKKYKDS